LNLYVPALATDKVDVHRLKVFEAIRATDEALLALQQRGGSRLTVITGRGRHPTGGNSVVKNAIIDRMKYF
ncbi:uncharacterized protein FOMMEDRAFT_84592, partial [Fomitiporia mediterranea MF3/22]|uniref:uncharacterized protein n=1 Tax=Fomitiporia mediterranea (strain MF3/22) TaxID=694068 RepID=UPI00044079D2